MIDLAGFRFQDPAWLWLALGGPLVVAAAIVRERSLRGLVFPGAGHLRRVRPGWRVRLRRLPPILAGLSLVAGAVALARPQQGSLRQDVTTRGVDIVVALDVSGSMAAEDFQPKNRLAVAREVVADFVERRKDDRVGLVVFAGKPLTKSPPTTDEAVLLRQLEDVKLGMLPDGTAIGSGMATALTRLRSSKARSRVIVLVTDGANNAGEIDPATATDLARALGVRVYAIAVGRGGEVPMPVTMRDPVTGQEVRRVVPMNVEIDEALLQRIATRTGAEFFRATDPASLRQIFDRIDKLEKSELRVSSYRRYRELHPPVLAVAAALLAAAALAWFAGLRVLPA